MAEATETNHLEANPVKSSDEVVKVLVALCRRVDKGETPRGRTGMRKWGRISYSLTDAGVQHLHKVEKEMPWPAGIRGSVSLKARQKRVQAAFEETLAAPAPQRAAIGAEELSQAIRDIERGRGNYTFYWFFDNMKLEGVQSMRIGAVTLHTLTSTRKSKIVREKRTAIWNSTHWSNDAVREQVFDNETHFWDELVGRTYGEVETHDAGADGARQATREHAQLALDVLHFLMPPSSRHAQIAAIDGYQIKRGMGIHLGRLSPHAFQTTMQGRGPLFSLTIDKEQRKSLYQFAIRRLNVLLSQEDVTDFGQSIVRCIQWAGRALATPAYEAPESEEPDEWKGAVKGAQLRHGPASQLVSLVGAMEALLRVSPKEPVTHSIVQRTRVLLGGDSYGQEVAGLYNLRSKLVHGDDCAVTRDDLWLVRDRLQGLVRECLKLHAAGLTSKERLRVYCEAVDLGFSKRQAKARALSC